MEPEKITQTDTVFLDPQDPISDFTFNQRVVSQFDDMIHRSVPLYDEIQTMIRNICQFYAPKQATICDLGCSLGTTIFQLSQALSTQEISFIGLDNSPDMLAHIKAQDTQLSESHSLSLISHDLNAPLPTLKADVVLLILTLQFVRPVYRDALIQSIYESLSPGGCLILVEKIIPETPVHHRLYVDLYHHYKKEQGYSELEISQKREALENVLLPYKRSENEALLERHQFSHIDLFFQWFNFAGFLALKKE